MRDMNPHAGSVVFGLVILGLWLCSIAAWVTHVIWAVGVLGTETVTTGIVALAIGGSLLPPLGIVHGYILWFT